MVDMGTESESTWQPVINYWISYRQTWGTNTQTPNFFTTYRLDFPVTSKVTLLVKGKQLKYNLESTNQKDVCVARDYNQPIRNQNAATRHAYGSIVQPLKAGAVCTGRHGSAPDPRLQCMWQVHGALVAALLSVEAAVDSL